MVHIYIYNTGYTYTYSRLTVWCVGNKLNGWHDHLVIAVFNTQYIYQHTIWKNRDPKTKWPSNLPSPCGHQYICKQKCAQQTIPFIIRFITRYCKLLLASISSQWEDTLTFMAWTHTFDYRSVKSFIIRSCCVDYIQQKYRQYKWTEYL